MTQEEMRCLIPAKLRELEEKYQITVLFAAESGSRAWGTASPDSDFDVRFIYKRSYKEYLRLEKTRDVIEIPIDSTWDVSGWDLSKALRLLYNSNPGLYDWIGSPVCYLDVNFKEKIMPLMRSYFSKERMMHHYYEIASRHIKELSSEDYVSPKKYFYALRSILACDWIDRENCAPPVTFSELSAKVLPSTKKTSVEYILDAKRNMPEKAKIKHIGDIDVFLVGELETIRDHVECLSKEKNKDWNELDSFFIRELSCE